jgi:hypothetical protein
MPQVFKAMISRRAVKYIDVLFIPGLTIYAPLGLKLCRRGAGVAVGVGRHLVRYYELAG